MKLLLRTLILALLVFAGLSAFSIGSAPVIASVSGPKMPGPCGGSGTVRTAAGACTQ